MITIMASSKVLLFQEVLKKYKYLKYKYLKYKYWKHKYHTNNLK